MHRALISLVRINEVVKPHNVCDIQKASMHGYCQQQANVLVLGYN